MPQFFSPRRKGTLTQSLLRAKVSLYGPSFPAWLRMRPMMIQVAVVVWLLAGFALAAPGQFSSQRGIGLTNGDQWEPAVAADGNGHVFVLYPHYGPVPGCDQCSIPTMLFVASDDNGKTWRVPRVVLDSGFAQFDPQIVVDPVDRRTIYVAWLQNRKREVVVARSSDSGLNWSFSIAARSAVELDKPVLALRGQSIFVGFNHEEEVWVAASSDGARTFNLTRANLASAPGWSLLGGATVDPSGNAYMAWSSYSRAGGLRGMIRLYVAKSADSGKTWNSAVLDSSSAAPDCAEEECGEAYLGAQVSLASDAGGTIYALWSAGGKPLGPQRIYFSSSTSAGESWLPRVDISRASHGVEHAFPTITAGRAGDVRIAWMDTRTSLWNTYYRSSVNGGAVWSDESRLSAYVPGYRYIKRKGFRFPFGDYFGIAIDSHDDTHVVWGEGMNYKSPGTIWHATGK